MLFRSNIGMNATKLYKDIYSLVKDKEYFVITTNVDDQFYKAGFDKNKIFSTQGSYRYIQCSNACHNKIYDASEIVKEMIKNTKDCKIPKNLIPICPVCGKVMETNLRKDSYFVQDDNWYKQRTRYNSFLEKNSNKNVLLLEFGVGFNTPGIIRLPFEQMVNDNNWKLVRINKDESRTFYDIDDKCICIKNDIKMVIDRLLE